MRIWGLGSRGVDAIPWRWVFELGLSTIDHGRKARKSLCGHRQCKSGLEYSKVNHGRASVYTYFSK